MPTLQQLRYLVAVADLLHFSRAADMLHVTQPTLSMQIKELEQRLGVPLIERNRNRVLMTRTGTEIAGRAREVLRQVDDIRLLARSADETGLDGILRIGVVHTVGAYLLSVAMPALHETFPNLRLYVREDRPENLPAQLGEGVHDIMILSGSAPRADAYEEVLLTEPFHLVMPADHRLAGLGRVSPMELAGETVLTMERGHRMHDAIALLCQRAGASLSRDYEGTSLDTLRQMVATGMGITLLPALYVRSEVMREKLVVARPLRTDAPTRSIRMSWRRSNPRHEAFLTLAHTMRVATRPFDINTPDGWQPGA